MRQLHDSLWVHEDSMKLGGVELSLRMTIVKLASGGLWVHSPTALGPDLKASVDRLGTVTALVAASNGHHLWLAEWADAFPDATTYVAGGIPKKVGQLKDFELIDAAADALWSQDLQRLNMGGVPMFDESVFLHRASASLIVTDLVQDHRGQEHRGFAKVITKLLMEPIGFKDICTAPPLRFKFVVKDRGAFVDFLNALQEWEFERIIVTHGNIIEDDAQATLARLCERFT